MYNLRSISVVMPALNEELGIQKVIQDFEDLNIFDQIIVVDNASDDGTRAVVGQTSAKLIIEPKRGYGQAIMTGLRACESDLIVLTESDGTFVAEDIFKLLSYIEHFDMVKGARSNVNLVSENADWRLSLQMGNLLVSKIMALLYFGSKFYRQSNLREMGGTFRVFTRESFLLVEGSLTETGSGFLADLTSLYLRNDFRVLELPVRYIERKGDSKITGSRWKTFILGARMLGIIFRNRIKPNI